MLIIINLIFFFFVFSSSCFASQVLINEFYTPTTSDWVELYNITDNPIDLTDWYLKDSKSNTKTITEASMSAKSFLVIEFSNRLDNGGDTVNLFNSSDQLQDSWSYSQDPGENICFGRSADGGAWHQLSPCSKGGSNNSSSIVDPSPSPSPSPSISSSPSPSPSPSSSEDDDISDSETALSSPSPALVVKTVKKASPSPSPFSEPEDEKQVLGEDIGHRENKEEDQKEEKEDKKFKLSLPIIISGLGSLLLLGASFPFLKPKLSFWWGKIRRKKRRKIIIHNS